MNTYKSDDVKQGPGGYTRVELPGYGQCWARLVPTDSAYREFVAATAVRVEILGWHRGYAPPEWRAIRCTATRRALVGTLSKIERRSIARILLVDDAALDERLVVGARKAA